MLRCVEECDGDGLLASVMSSIQDVFCDRCTGCNGYVDDPQSFDRCLCLECNHCPICFCGFCYQYAGSWNDTHVRENFGEAIIAVWTLSEERKQEARRRMENLQII